jgi:cobalamin biosynthesis protein CobD/CbiB
MTFLSVLFALVLEHYLSWRRRDRMVEPFLRWCDLLRRLLDAGTARHGVLAWCLAVLPVVLVGIAIQPLAWWAGGGGLAWILNVLVLVAVIDFRTLSEKLTELGSALREDRLTDAGEAIALWEGAALPGEFDAPGLCSRAIQIALLHAHWRVLAPILWFVLLPGASGPLLYCAARSVSQRWTVGGSGDFAWFAKRSVRLLDWLPARLSALSFAFVGNFEESLHCWRTQTLNAPDDHARVVLAAGAGAIGVHFEPAPALPYGISNGDLGVGDFPGPEHLQNTEGLLARTMVVSVVLLGLLTLAGLLGA